MRTVIGLAGVKTSGKSTVTNMIQNMVEAKESALADKLKNTCSETFSVPRENFDKQELKEVPFEKPIVLQEEDLELILGSFGLPVSIVEEKLKTLVGMELTSPRHIAQIVGTEVLRAAGDEDVHCKNVKVFNDSITVISDLRFPNEFSYFNDNNDIQFIPLYIQRDEAEKHVDMEKSHASETSVFLFSEKCVRVDNNGTLKNTEEQIKEVLSKEL